MTTLAQFCERYVPRVMRESRDYTGPQGWVWLMNQLLRRMEAEGLVELTQRKETGVLIHDDYWITLPSDFRRVESIVFPGLREYKPERDIGWEIINGKIRIDTPIDLDDDDTFAFTLSEGGLSSVKINDTDAAANFWEENLLVLTNGTYSGDCIIIGEHAAASAGLTTLNFLHTRATSISTSTTGYLTANYALLKYFATFTGLAASSDTLPVDDKYSSFLFAGLCYLAKPVGSEERDKFREEFEFEIDILKREQNTQTPDQMRPDPRPMAGLENCDDFPYSNIFEDDTFVGEGLV